VSTYSKATADGTRKVTLALVPDGLRVAASDDDGPVSRPVRLVTTRPGDYARAIGEDLAASGYDGPEAA
jgi:hypothetical protein